MILSLKKNHTKNLHNITDVFLKERLPASYIALAKFFNKITTNKESIWTEGEDGY